MRILEIRFRNLNSLAGEWHIDLTHPAYSADGIFAITGPTGAGKTTILDALCLALYGATPRLGRVTRSGNEIMSRHTGGCFAEVVFETPAGRFRCHWSQHRAHRKPAGELQAPRHEVSDADSGELLQSRLRDTAACIEETTGMDFERFTRSMLLAQGGFAAFLQAPPDARAPILEQITGTGIYSRISMKVHQLRAGERQQLERLTAELEGLSLLSGEERARLTQALEASEGEEADLAQRVAALKEDLAWREALQRLEEEHGALEARLQDLARRKEAFAPRRLRLERDRKARELEADAARVATLAAAQEKDAAALTAAREELPELEGALARKAEREKNAAREVAEKRQRRRTRSAVIREVREMDVHIENRRSRLAALEGAVAEAEEQCRSHREAVERLTAGIAEQRAAIARIDAYLARFSADAGLVENMAAIGRLFESLDVQNALLSENQRALAQAAAGREAAVREEAGKAAALRRIEKRRQRERDAFERAGAALSRLLEGRRLSDWHRRSADIKERIVLLERLAEVLAHREQIRRETDEATDRIAALEKESAELAEAVAAARRLEALLQEEVRHLETEVSLRVRIHDLTRERRMLEDGRPCPLCGATEHPYAAGNVPELDESRAALEGARRKLAQAAAEVGELRVRQAGVSRDLRQARERLDMLGRELAADGKRCRELCSEIALDEAATGGTREVEAQLSRLRREMAAVSDTIDRIETATAEKERRRTALETGERVLADAEKARQAARHRLDTARREHQRLEQECKTARQRLDDLLREARRTLESYGVDEVLPERLDELLASLTERRDKWRRRLARRQESEKILAGLEKDLEKQRALLDGREEALRSRRREYETLSRDLAERVAKRRATYGRRDPDREERQLADEEQAAVEALEAVRQEIAALAQQAGRVKEHIRLLTVATRERASELAAARSRLSQGLRRRGFADEQDFRSARLAEEEREALNREARELEQEETRLRTRLADRKAALDAMRGERTTREPAEELARKLSAAADAHAEAQRHIGALREQLERDRRQRRRRRTYLAQIEKQQRECARWDALHDLIGSADGKKYRNFAQGLTFEIMIAHANRRLTGMTDRYLLVRDRRQPLALNVIDSYQAGEIRSTRNLSGGESFLVSLALALGLSRMASRNVRVDSLFLDEGFGTLDDEALETALETLSGLQQQGKLIGVISHVPALRERIATQIRVIRGPGGCSRIEGPGCCRADG